MEQSFCSEVSNSPDDHILYLYPLVLLTLIYSSSLETVSGIVGVIYMYSWVDVLAIVSLIIFIFNNTHGFSRLRMNSMNVIVDLG